MDPRKPAASASLSKWGLVQGWLAANLARRVEIRASSEGLTVRVTDPVLGEELAEIRATEDPSTAAWRAVVLLDRGR